MIISNQKNALDIKIRETILIKVSTVKFVGVTLDENLTFKDNVNKVTCKISKSVGVMRGLHCQSPAKRNGQTVLFFGVFPSDLCFTGMEKIGKCC